MQPFEEIWRAFFMQKKASNFFEAFEFWVADRVRTGDPRHHKPIL